MTHNKTIGIALLALLTLSVISLMPFVPQEAYADDPDIFKFYPDGCTANEDIKGVEITTNYFVTLCGSSSVDVKFNLRSNGNTTAGTSVNFAYSATPSTIWVQAMGLLDCVTFYVDSTTDTYKKSCFDGSTVTTSTYTPSCTPLASQYLNKPLTAGGGEVYYPILCSGGTIEIVRSTTMTLLTTLTGVTSGSPTCTTPRSISLFSATQGTIICDSSNLLPITFDIFGGGAIQKYTSEPLINTNNRIHVTTVVNGGAITYISSSTGGKLEFVKWSVATLTYGTILDNQLFGSGSSAFAVIAGQAVDSNNNTVGAICSADSTDDSIICFETNNNSPEPPNNQILNFPLGSNVNTDAPINSTGGDTYIIGQGDDFGGGATPYYFIATGLVTPLPPSIPDGETTPDNPNLPDNDIPDQGNLWGCRLGFIPKEFCIPDPDDPDCNPDPTNRGCQWIPDPDHDDIKTNGMGWLINFLLMGGLMAVVIGASHGKRLFQTANLALYAVVIIGSLGIGMLFGWHDGVIFWVGVFAIVSLGGLKIAQMAGFIKSGGDSDD